MYIFIFSLIINLYYFPDNIKYTIELHKHIFEESFHFEITGNYLITRRIDKNAGWIHKHSIDICFQSKTSFYFFQEEGIERRTGCFDPLSCAVTYNNNKILDSRDPDYFHNNGW